MPRQYHPGNVNVAIDVFPISDTGGQIYRKLENHLFLVAVGFGHEIIEKYRIFPPSVFFQQMASLA